MNEESLLQKIAKELEGIAWDDLTTAEKNIAKLLIKEGYLDDYDRPSNQE